MLANRDRLLNLAWLFFWGALSTAWCWSAGHTLGPTFDERPYIQSGLKNWRELNHRDLLAQGTMPLPGEVHTLPVRIAEWWLDIDASAAWLDWVPTARMANAAFWWVLLWASFRLGSIYGGAVAGRLALALAACEPILLGHASLATTDIPFTACLLGLLASFRARRDLPGWCGRLLLPAVWCMLTFMCKASALVFVPIALGVVEAERLWSAGWRPSWKRDACMSLRDLAAIGAMGMVLLFAVCPRASRGLLFQIRHNLEGHGGSYLLEQFSPAGFWYYFPTALAIKLGLPVMMMGVMILLVRPRCLLNAPLFAALGLIALTPTFKVQIGVRFVLPITVLAIIAASIAFANWWNAQTGTRRNLGAAFASALVAWSLTNACLVWPHGICYTNELFGGTSRGYLALSDSNYDWGQGMPELIGWQREHADAPIYLWPFGTDPRVHDAQFSLVAPADLTHGEEVARFCRGGYLAASTTMLYGYHFNSPAAQYLRTLQPCGRTTTFLIYDFRN